MIEQLESFGKALFMYFTIYTKREINKQLIYKLMIYPAHYQFLPQFSYNINLLRQQYFASDTFCKQYY